MNIYWTVIPLIIILYIVMVGCVYAIQDYFVFKPVQLDKEYIFEFDQKFEEYNIPTIDNHLINTILFAAEGKPKGLIIYYHGNADNLQRWGKYAVDFTTKGYDVLMMDYRGFGKTEGKMSELLMKQDAEALMSWADKNINYSKLIFYGRSLGTGIATYMGANYNADLVILETPFYSIRDIFEEKGGIFTFPIQFKNPFENFVHIPNIQSPIVIFHGTEDEIVPYSSAIKLKPLLNKNDTFYTFEGAKHKNLAAYDKFHEKLILHLDEMENWSND